MRERALGWRGIDSGMVGEQQVRVYASPETHSSIDKAIRIAGIGQQHLVKVPTDGSWALDSEALRRAIDADRAARRLARPTACSRPSKWHESTISTSTSMPRGLVPR